MSQLYKSAVEFLKDENGLTVVEYVISAALLVVVLSGVLTVFYGLISDKFKSIVGG